MTAQRIYMHLRDDIIFVCVYLFLDSPPAQILTLASADLGVEGLDEFLLSGPAVGDPVKLLLGEEAPELVR